MKTAKVTEVLDVKEWNGPNGTVFYHKIRLDNGDAGEIGKKAHGGVKVGDSLNYEITPTEHGNKIKQVQDNHFGGGGGKGRGAQGSPASFALAYARDISIALIPLHPEKTPTDWVQTTLAVADKFYQWMSDRQEK